MPVDVAASLPRSHYFISLVHGTSTRTIRMRAGVARSGVIVIAVLLVWLVGATGYLLFHDDLVASLMSREAQMQYAYEDRIAALRGQVEHETSLNLVNQSSIEGRVRELAQRAATLEMRASLVSELASRLHLGNRDDPSATAGLLLAPTGTGGVPREMIDNPSTDEPRGSNVPKPLAVTPSPKPRPEASSGWKDGIAVADAPDRQPINLRLAAVTGALEHVDASQYVRLAAIGLQAHRRVEAIHESLADAGIAPERFKLPALQSSDMGGPYVPLDPAIEASPFGRAVDALQSDVLAADSLTRIMPNLPFSKPMSGAIEITSPFGARLDPFLGRPAMHTGVDLREDYGTDVRATAAGRVVSAGPAGGYGVMVEVDHGHGLSTRYAHLSAVLVAPGEMVTRGQTVGEVGATGRATGPHLHYETRIDGEAVDPMRFLAAGSRLASLDLSH